VHRPPLRALCLVVTLLLVPLAACSDDDDGTPPPTTLAPPPEANVPYGDGVECPGDPSCGGAQSLDIYRSDEDGPNPVVLFVHGGGFVGGDKAGSISEYLQPLLDDGWDIVSANYHLTTDSGEHGYPVALLETKRAVRWIKANAAAQDWDPAAVAAMGHSAGGNLVEMLAVTAGDPELEPTDLPPELAAVDSSVIAAVSLSAVSDLAGFSAQGMFTDAVRRYLGCRETCSDAAFAGASVWSHVTPEAAPILAFHDTQDPLAPPEQGTMVQEAYDAAGIGDRFEMVTIDDGPEEFRGHVPDLERWIDQIEEFLDEHLPEQP